MFLYSNVAKDKCFAYNVTHIEEGEVVWWIVGKNKYLTYGFMLYYKQECIFNLGHSIDICCNNIKDPVSINKGKHDKK